MAPLLRACAKWTVLVAVSVMAALAVLPAAGSDEDNDGLPDQWETTAGRAFGCDPRHADLVVYAVMETDLADQVNATIARAVKFFDGLPVPNPDRRPGIHLHVIRGPKINRPEGYAQLKDLYLPKSLVGRAHFHVFSTDPGGQTCVECNASISGVQSAGWQSFVHELGHQLGLDHPALGFKVQSPLHASVMNYAYLGTFDGSEDNVRYSDGHFASLKMRETNLDETLPFPAADLEFLTKDPYHFSIRPAGNRTEVDWNRNGIFGEKGVRADINYQGGSWLGDRVNVEEVSTAPAAAYRDRDFYVVYGVAPPGKPRTIVLRKAIDQQRWGPRVAVNVANPAGDPTMTAYDGMLWVASATGAGTTVITGLRPDGDGAKVDPHLSATLPNRPAGNVTLAVLDNRLYLFVRAVATNRVAYRVYSGTGSAWGPEQPTNLLSKTAPAVAWQPIGRQAVIVTVNDRNVPNRLVVNLRAITGGTIAATGAVDVMGGTNGGTATKARPAVFVDTTRDAGPDGRVFAYYRAGGDHDSAYFSMQIADRRFNGGWLERVAFDQWSKTASAPAAAMSPSGEVTYCYRDEGDNVLKCAFHASGIEEGGMGDADELTFIRTHGLHESLQRK